MERRPRGGVPCAIVRSPLPRLPAIWAGCRGPLPMCCERGCASVGAQDCYLGLHALWGLCAAGAVGGRPLGGWPATVVRGVRLASGAVPPPAARPLAGVLMGFGWGSAARVSRVRLVRAWGPSTGPTAALCAVGVAGGHPRGGGLSPVWGASEVRCSPSPGCPPSGQAVGVHHPLAVGVGVRAWVSPWLARLAGAACRWGGSGAVPGGGWPATVLRGVWCQALSLSWPPVPGGRQPGFRDPCVPGAVGVGVGTWHLPHSVRPCGPALRAVGVAEGRPQGGCLSPL